MTLPSVSVAKLLYKSLRNYSVGPLGKLITGEEMLADLKERNEKKKIKETI